MCKYCDTYEDSKNIPSLYSVVVSGSSCHSDAEYDPYIDSSMNPPSLNFIVTYGSVGDNYERVSCAISYCPICGASLE